MLSNCFLWAHIRERDLWREWRAMGSPVDRVPCVMRRPSRLHPDWIPHWVVGWWHPETATLHEVEGFVPDDGRPLPWWRLPAACLFRGRVKRGDHITTHKG